MAYLNFAEPPVLTPVIARHDPVSADEGLSALDWSVVALARRDTLSSLRQPGRMAKALARIFGDGTSNRLADPRLEAVRRVAVHAWHHGFAIPQSEIDAFHAEGLGVEALEQLVTSISRARSERRRKAF